MNEITTMKTPVKLFVAITPEVAAIAERIAPELSKRFAAGEEPASVHEVVEAMLLRGAVAMEQEYLRTSTMNPNSMDEPARRQEKPGLLALAMDLMNRACGLGVAA